MTTRLAVLLLFAVPACATASPRFWTWDGMDHAPLALESCQDAVYLVDCAAKIDSIAVAATDGVARSSDGLSIELEPRYASVFLRDVREGDGCVGHYYLGLLDALVSRVVFQARYEGHRNLVIHAETGSPDGAQRVPSGVAFREALLDCFLCAACQATGRLSFRFGASLTACPSWSGRCRRKLGTQT